jgi:hypothetical protein
MKALVCAAMFALVAVPSVIITALPASAGCLGCIGTHQGR